MVQDRAIFTMANQQKVAYGLSNGAIFNDLERPLTWFSRSRHTLTLNISNGHSYYRRRIGNRTQAFEWHQFQWHWVTSNPDIKVTMSFDVKKLQNGTRYSYHGLHGSAGTVLTAITLSYGKWRNSTPHRIKTPSLVDMKLWTYDYVRGVWREWWNITSKIFFISRPFFLGSAYKLHPLTDVRVL